MKLISELHNTLSVFFNWHKSRLDCLGQIIQALTALSKLQKLSLEGCRNITAEGLLALAKYTHLIELNLSSTKADDTVIQALASLSNLEKLDLGGCRNITAEGLFALSKHMHLIELDLRFINLDLDAVIQALGGLRNLQKLHFDRHINLTSQGLLALRNANDRIVQAFAALGRPCRSLVGEVSQYSE